MSGEQSDLQKTPKQEEQTIQVRQQLTSLQTWEGVEGGETLEQRRSDYSRRFIQREKEENQALVAHVHEYYEKRVVTTAAPGTPIQELEPASKTWKRRREEQKQLDEVKKHVPNGDYTTYIMRSAVTQSRALRENSLSPSQAASLEKRGVDVQAISAFLSGYQTGKLGRPLNEAEARKRDADQKFIDDYSSGQPELRAPYLKRFSNMVLEMKLDGDMFTEQYLEGHITEMTILSQQLMSFRRMLRDPANADFFNCMDPLERQLLEIRCGPQADAFTAMLANRMAEKGLRIDGSYADGKTQDLAVQRRAQAEDAFHNSMANCQEQEDAACRQRLEEEMAQVRRELMQDSDNIKKSAEEVEEFSQLKGLQFTGYVTGETLDQMARLRSMIESAPQIYQAHQGALSFLYQQLYRHYDVLGDLILENTVAQNVSSLNFNGTAVQHRIAAMADRIQEASHLDTEMLLHQINGTADAILFFVKNHTLSERAQNELQRAGFLEEALQLQAQRQQNTEADAPALVQAQAQTQSGPQDYVDAPVSGTAQRTRQEAASTYSDQRSDASRMQLAELNKALRAAGLGDVAELVDKYVQGTRYTVGYTKERKYLQNAMKAVENALGKVQDGEQLRILRKMKSYFGSMTNGTLEVPANEAVQDFSKEEPPEAGIDCDGSIRTGLLRTFTYWSDQTDTPLFSHEPTVNDLKQRFVSNCYMVASTAGLTNMDPELLKSCLKDNMDGTVTVRLYEKYVSEEEKEKERKSREEAQRRKEERERIREEKEMLGTYTEEDEMNDEIADSEDELNIYRAKEELRAIYVKVSKKIPRIAGADALSAGALWMQMIEKACAFVGRKGAKGYKSLWYGEGGGFLERLLGQSPERVSKEDTLFDNICNARKQGFVYNAGSGGTVGAKDGLNAGHAYTVMGGKEENGQRYVLLRNPYSTMSLQEKDGQTSRTGRMFDTSSDETYGQFYMKFEEFLDKFETVTRTDLNAVRQRHAAEAGQ